MPLGETDRPEPMWSVRLKRHNVDKACAIPLNEPIYIRSGV
eukprot:CAMPEP_0116855700 /NCGR_PEP_ID=MMETSP0418-20121206/19443_1 /TAXON_ID=1158023 /ORGANISM="Astrosyne radiata, Strain 13vi08-1A" /LENGTH=40 /DNA_ID= /DNA_START= /DNA_END= /DNA_ORIENTATION=